jgi:branched-chain amino acid transport system permease protein
MDFGPHLMLASLEGAVISAILVLTAMGLSVVFGVMRVVNVAHGEFYMLGAVLTWFITSMVGGHPAIGFVAAIVVAPLLVGCLAAGADRLILKRVNYDPDRTIVATIGMLYIIQQTTLMTFGPEARPVEAPFNTRLSLPWFEWGENGFAMICAQRRGMTRR